MDIDAIQRSIITASRVQHEYSRKILDILSEINTLILSHDFGPYDWSPIFTAYPPGNAKGLTLDRWALDFLPLNNFFVQWAKGNANSEGYTGIHMLHVIDSGIINAIASKAELLPERYSEIEKSFTYFKFFITRFEKGAKPVAEEVWGQNWFDFYGSLYGMKWSDYCRFDTSEKVLEKGKIKTETFVQMLTSIGDRDGLKKNLLDQINTLLKR